MLLLGVPEVEEEVGHESQSSLAPPVYFSDDRGPGRVREYPQSKAIKRYLHQNGLPGTRYKKENESGLSRRQYWNPRFPWIHKREPFAFHSAKTPPSQNHLAVPS